MRSDVTFLPPQLHTISERRLRRAPEKAETDQPNPIPFFAGPALTFSPFMNMPNLHRPGLAGLTRVMLRLWHRRRRWHWTLAGT